LLYTYVQGVCTHLVLHRDEITHRDVWRCRTSVIYDACDVGCCHKSLMYDLMMLPVWGNQ
jgi:hypothetical protein